MSKPPVLQRHQRTICPQRGTTMIEVMVAALVLSAGLLGLAAMQTRALKTASGLATQQVMVQTLSAYNEARLSAPNTSISGGTKTDIETQLVTIDRDLSSWCTALWRGVSVITSFPNPNTSDFTYFNTFLGTYTPCGNTALTDYAEYWNRYGGSEFQQGRECDYIVPETHLITCTLATGDQISMENLVWVR
jgi:type II secretory pathway pseudopilin PulG